MSSPHSPLSLLAGAGYLGRGFGLIWRPSIRAFVLMPLLINIAVVVGLLLWLWPLLGRAVAGWLALLPEWLAWLAFLVWPIVWLLAALAFCFALTILANLVAAPFNGFLAARVEQHLTGTPPHSGLTVGQEAVQGLLMESRKFIFFVSRAIPLALLSLLLIFIPGLNALIPLLWLAFGAYMLAFEYIDYPASNHALSFARKRELLARYRSLSLGFGAIVTLLSAVPLANLLVMPAAVAGATALWVEHLAKENHA